MRILDIDGRQCPFYEVKDFNKVKNKILADSLEVVYSKGKIPKGYVNTPCAFDIETTTCNIGTKFQPKYAAFMYHWQFAINTTCFFGRYWDEFMELLELLEKTLELHETKRLVIYAHFAAYEFQFLRNFIYVENIFARKRRVPIKVDFNYAFELRCSWALSNMSLEKAIENTPNAFFTKKSGAKFDYLVKRLPTTPLSDYEAIYCYCDVAGLVEYLTHLLEEDDIASLPLTSTGFIRREFRKRVTANPKNYDELHALALTPSDYITAKMARRGGNCHGNAIYTNMLLENVGSNDRKSSYPAEMMSGLYPMSKFRIYTPTEDMIYELLNDKAMLIELTFWDILLKPDVPIPYIPKAKCIRLPNKKDDGEGCLQIDNGRIVKADYATMVITDIDFKIILSQYNIYGGIEVSKILGANYGKLNKEFREYLLEMFKEKCRLEFGDKYLYNKFKNKINASFGMMLTDITSPEILYNPIALLPKDIWKEGEIDIDAMLSRYYGSRSSFLSYQHGIWVTANARYQHQLGIDACGMDTVYGDTDSVKYIGEHQKDFDRLNKQWLDFCDNNDMPMSVTVNGKTTTLGVWENEGVAEEFVFLGAKKYAYKQDGKLKITVAGLNKKDGAKWLEKNGGLEAFTIGTIVPPEYSGRTTSYYIDVDEPYELTVDGVTFTTGSAIATVPTTYEFGVSDDYLAYFTSVQ